MSSVIGQIRIEKENPVLGVARVEPGAVWPLDVIPGRNGGLAQLLKSYGATHWFSTTANIHGDDQNLPNLVNPWGGLAHLGSNNNPLGDTSDPVWLKPSPEASAWIPGNPTPTNSGYWRRIAPAVSQFWTDTFTVRIDMRVPPYGPILAGQDIIGGNSTQQSFRFKSGSRQPAFRVYDTKNGAWMGVGAGGAGEDLAHAPIPEGINRAEIEATFFFPSGVTSYRYRTPGGLWVGLGETESRIPVAVDATPNMGGERIVGGTTTGLQARKELRVYRGEWYLDGVLNVVFDPTNLSAWTLTQAESGLKIATVPAGRGITIMNGVDDHIQLPNDAIPQITATEGELTAIVVQRMHAPQPGTRRLLDYRSTVADGLTIECQSAGIQPRAGVYGDDGGSGFSNLPVVNLGERIAIGVRMGGGEMHAISYGEDVKSLAVPSSNPTSEIGEFTLAAPRIGAQSYFSGGGWNMEFFDFVQFDRRISNEEFVTVAESLFAGEVVA